MMSHRDLGYGYMPQPVPAYPATQSHYSSLAAMSGYYSDISRQISPSPNPGYISSLNFPRYSVSTEDRESREKVQQRRRKNSTERRHQVKFLARKANTVPTADGVRATALATSRPPQSIMSIALEESPIQTSPDDIFTTQASLQPSNYTTDHYARAASFEPTPALRRDEYQPASLPYNMPQQAMSSPPTYSAYTMATISQSMPSLAPPPHIPSPSQQHTYPGADRSSPLHIQGPTHAEPISIDTRRDKPQCWEHGCNGREFSTFSNLLRHQREKSGSATKAYCPHCGAEFTRTTARNGHMEHGKCKSRRASVAGNSTISQSGSGGGSVNGSISGITSLR